MRTSATHAWNYIILILHDEDTTIEGQHLFRDNNNNTRGIFAECKDVRHHLLGRQNPW